MRENFFNQIYEKVTDPNKPDYDQFNEFVESKYVDVDISMMTREKLPDEVRPKPKDIEKNMISAPTTNLFFDQA